VAGFPNVVEKNRRFFENDPLSRCSLVSGSFLSRRPAVVRVGDGRSLIETGPEAFNEAFRRANAVYGETTRVFVKKPNRNSSVP